MSNPGKRKQISGERNDRSRENKRLRSGGTSYQTKRQISGPGIWVSCVRGKERQTIGEIYDLFDSLASEIWPISDPQADKDDQSEDDEVENLSLEQQIAKEVSIIKRPRSEQRFANCQTDTQCVVFISCKEPVDPVQLTMKYVQTVQETGTSRTRYTQRLVPVSGTCYAGIAEMKELCEKVFNDFFSKPENMDQKLTYKIELRIRNHTTLTRPTIIQHIATWVPEGHAVSLSDPDMFILVEVFKSVCGISIVRDYYKYSKFNVLELANAKKRQDADEAERHAGASKTEVA